MKISVIIPVYNCSRYLSECLDSILNQSFENWECICVDDGSQDESGMICDEYGAKDHRFRIIHQSNMGADGARNRALSVAEGDWITFVDADDVIAREWFATAARIVEQDTPDMVRLSRLSGSIVPEGFFSMKPGFETVKHEGKTGIEWALRTLSEEGYIWRCFIRKEIARKHDFRPNILCKEDGLWLVELIPYLRTIIEGSYEGYFYRIANVNSLTKKSRRGTQCVAYLKAWEDIWTEQREWAQRQGVEDVLRERLTQAVNQDVLEWVLKRPKENQVYAREIWNEYRKLVKIGSVLPKWYGRMWFRLPFAWWKLTGQTWGMSLTISVVSLGRTLLKKSRAKP